MHEQFSRGGGANTRQACGKFTMHRHALRALQDTNGIDDYVCTFQQLRQFSLRQVQQ